jgi:ABC-type sugar transport system permease subunit
MTGVQRSVPLTRPKAGFEVMLAAPLLLYLALFVAYPTAYALKLAITDTLTQTFPSLSNFRLLWDDRLFWRAVLGNLALPLLSVAVELALGLALALLLASRFPGRRALRAIVVIPFALPEIVFLTAMRYAFAPRGYVNAALVAAGMQPVQWLAPGHLVTWCTVVAADAWHVTPIVFLMLLAALTAIPEEIAEAARLDGAGGLRRLAFITLPLLWPALIAALLLRGVDAIRVFATPLVLTGVEGLPVLSTYAYHQWSDYGNDGAAAAAASVLALLSVMLTLPLLRRRAVR